MDEEFVRVWGRLGDREPPGVDCLDVLGWCKEHRPLIILDTLIRFLSGDESSAADIARTFEKFRGLIKTGTTLLMLHHAGKGQSSSECRGSTDIPGSVDVAYLLQRKDGAIGLYSLTLRQFKTRCADPPDPISLRLSESGFEVTDDPSGKRHNDAVAAAVNCVKDHPGLPVSKLVELIRGGGIGRNEAERAVKSAVAEGLIVTKSGARGANECFAADFLELTV